MSKRTMSERAEKCRELFDRGHDRGNHAAAYEGVGVGVGACGIGCLEALRLKANQPNVTGEDGKPLAFHPVLWQAWNMGFVLGVYSSFERHEIAESEVEVFDHAVDFAKEHGLDTNRDEE